MNEFKNNELIGLELTYLNKDGEEGYLGNISISVKAIYTLTNDNALRIDYETTID